VIVLGIETSTTSSSVALRAGDAIIERTSSGVGHAEFLMPAIMSLCVEARIELRAVEGIGVSVGPGLFTGMRVGIATARTIGRLLGTPVVGIPSLDALAFTSQGEAAIVCASIDAKRKEVFAGLYRGGVERVGELRAWPPDELASTLGGYDDVLVVGNGGDVYGSVFERVSGVRIGPTGPPSAAAIAALAIPQLERGEGLGDLEPLYLRKTDAEITWEQRGVVIERPLRVKVPKRARGGAG